MTCQVCDGRSRLAFTQQIERRLDFYLCRDCGLLFAGNDIPDEQLAEAYASFDIDSYYERVGTTSRAKAENAVDDLTDLISDDALVVDLGCGGGHFLRAIRERTAWRAVGYDLDDASVARCRAEGLNATTHLAGLPTADLVTMLDLAEHVKDPMNLLHEASCLVHPGGLLYLHTPRRCIWDTLAIHFVRFGPLRPAGAMWLRTRVSTAHLRLWSDAALEIATRKSRFQVLSYRRELELSWPLAMYLEVYVGEKLGAPRSVVRAATALGHIAASCRLIRNKAVLVARFDPI